jgi:hypothetical protein
MSANNSSAQISIGRLILVPAIITLAITVVRLIGELQHWPSALFRRDPGGLGSIVGIVWLAPIFGIYFAVKLCRAGAGPGGAAKDIGLSVLGAVLMVGGGFFFGSEAVKLPGKQALAVVLLVGSVAMEYFAWPKLFKVLIAYGYAARIPVLIIMFFAMQGNWGTHYDAVPPNAPTDFWPRFIELAVVPQMIFWILFTLVSGSIFGAVTAAMAGGEKRMPQTA